MSSFEDLKVVRAAFGAVTVSVVSPMTLCRMKRDTVRLKDQADAASIKERSDHRRVQRSPIASCS